MTENDIWLEALPEEPPYEGSIESVIDKISGLTRASRPDFEAKFEKVTGVPSGNSEGVGNTGSDEEELVRIQHQQGLSSIDEARDWWNRIVEEGRILSQEQADKERVYDPILYSAETKGLLGLPLDASDYRVAIELDRRYSGMTFEEIMEALNKK